ncbi:MAG: cation-translocating P-type ATPase, partial [Actinomycetota bacterium]|nr:cation-translocating P-type ATPase [Actinomycetota bacterium]
MLRLSVPSPAAVVRTVSSAGLELLGAHRARRSWSGHGRAWIEVRGIDAQDGHWLADAVATEVRAVPGVRWAETNRALARLVVECEPEGPSVEGLCALVCEIEERFSGSVGNEDSDKAPRSADLPCDSAVVAGRLVALGADAVGLGLATAGRLFRWPRLPGAALAAVVLIDSQPRIRRVVEGRLGAEAADVVLATATAAAQAFAQGPASLTVDLVLRTVLLAEARAAQQAWHRDEPMLAQSASCAEAPVRRSRPVPVPPGPIERYSDVAATGGLAAAAAIALSTGGSGAGADAVLVAAPRATRAARETFVATLAAGLSARCGSLVLRPSALRRLDRIDAVVLDPRALVGSQLSVAEVRGVEGIARTRVWQAAGEDVNDGLLGPGWHPLSAMSPAHELENVPADVRVLISPLRDPLSEVLVAAARAAELDVTSLDVPELGTLRSAFDNLVACDGDVDEALCEAVRDLQRAGRCVAVFGASAPHAFANADLAIALTNPHDTVAWTADVLVPDLTVAWRLMVAVPAARRASRRGVELAAGGAVLGGLLM